MFRVQSGFFHLSSHCRLEMHLNQEILIISTAVALHENISMAFHVMYLKGITLKVLFASLQQCLSVSVHLLPQSLQTSFKNYSLFGPLQ